MSKTTVFIGRNPKAKIKEGLFLLEQQKNNKIKIVSTQLVKDQNLKKVEGINHQGLYCEDDSLIPFSKIDRVDYIRL
jgi:hypothetical protein